MQRSYISIRQVALLALFSFRGCDLVTLGQIPEEKQSTVNSDHSAHCVKFQCDSACFQRPKRAQTSVIVAAGCLALNTQTHKSLLIPLASYLIYAWALPALPAHPYNM